MKTRCIIVDDEPLARKLIKSYVSRFDFIEVVAECKNAMQAIDSFRVEKVDLMFLDISMPNITGLEFLKSLPHPPYVIIITAYREYALEGFDLDVVDYLLKPVSFERFLKAINKFCERQESRLQVTNSSPEKVSEPFLYIQDGKTIHKVFYNDIMYLEGYGEYVKVHTTNKIHLSRESMHDYETKLSCEHFLRIHKSFIIPIAKVNAFTTTSVIIKGEELPIGRSYKDSVFHALNFTKKNA